jgi:uncharacterized protein YycO
MKQYVFAALVATIFVHVGSMAQTNVIPKLKEGDIVLQKIPCGGLCDAIIETTPCAPGRMFNHCGIVHYENNQPYVIEAIGKVVQQSPLPDFLKRDSSSILYVARMKPKYASYIETAVKKAIVYVGTPYDDAFLPGDDALYCSELIWKVFKKNDSPNLFDMQPMTFKSKSGKTFPAWQAYYKDLKMPIPEGKPGINPCAIANSEVIDLIMVSR